MRKCECILLLFFIGSVIIRMEYKKNGSRAQS